MMLPTDMALKTDPVFAQHAAAYVFNEPRVLGSCSVSIVQSFLHVLLRYAADQQLFFKDFRSLVALQPQQ
jgi:hypothetical protein